MAALRVLVVACLLVASATLGHAQQRRQVPLEGQTNFRDIGGYKTTDGRVVKRGLVYRSGELSDLTRKDVAKLEELGIKTAVTFLTPQEEESRGKDRLPKGARGLSLPIETEGGLAAAADQARQTADFSKLPPDINPEIHRLLVEEAQRQYAALFKEIAKTDAPLVLHCSHGVHRTGTATAVLLWGLGVPWETVRQDYLLSNKCRKSEVERRLRELRELAAKTQSIAPEEVDMTSIEAFYVLQGSYIDATRDAILQKYGSIENYLTNALGVTERDVDRLQRRLLE